LRDVLAKLRLRSFAKVSGSKGIQVYAPLNTPITYAATQPFARAVAELLEREHIDLVVSDMAKNLRVGNGAQIKLTISSVNPETGAVSGSVEGLGSLAGLWDEMIADKFERLDEEFGDF
jgi:hypothetical protein